MLSWKHVLILVVTFTSHSTLAKDLQALLQEQAQERIISIQTSTKAPSLSIAAAKHGKLLFAVTSGMANKSAGIHATPATEYRTGSIAKVIGTTAFMKLVEQKKVNLDASIRTYLGYLPSQYDKPTIKHLMTHTGGVRHYNWGEYGTNTHYRTLEQATKVFAADKLRFEPGTDYLYSTYGINLIQGVIEKVTNKPLNDFMNDTLFGPLEMTNTSLEMKGNDDKNYALGYRSFLTNTPVKDIDVSNKYIGGGMRSTPTDLVNMVSAIEFESYLKRETKQTMLEAPFKLVAADRALGWRLMEYQGAKAYGHGGAVNGFESLLVHFIEDEITIAIMVNQDDYDFTSSTLYEMYHLIKKSTP